MTKPKINKLSIYLIRDDKLTDEQILKPASEDDDAKRKSEDAKRESVVIPNLGTLYYIPSIPKTPTWIMKFFGSPEPDLKLKTAIARAALIVRIKIDDNEQRTFAVCFGHGYLLLNLSETQERFGLQTVLNAVNPDSLRRLDTKNQGSMPKDAHEQVSQSSGIGAFTIDVEQDLLLGMTGLAKDNRFGKTICGKDALSVSVPVSATGLPAFLKLCYEYYIKTEYTTAFPWVDHIKAVKQQSLVDMLEEKLIERLRSEPGHMWMAVPELIDWNDVDGFKFSDRKSDKTQPYDDIQLESFLQSLTKTERTNLSIDLLQKKSVYCHSASAERALKSWHVYHCIYCEELDEEGGKVYLLCNSKWYEVERDYVEQVNKEYEEVRNRAPTCVLPVYDPKGNQKYSETVYNKEASVDNENFVCLDGPQHFIYSERYGTVEICDLYSQQKQFIHVKRYSGSSVLSHLFNQGVISGELFRREQKFREQVNEKLPDSHRIHSPATRPSDGEYEVVYTIVSDKKSVLDIPFFSKISLRNARNHLEQLCGYRVSLVKVETVDAA